MPSLRDRLLGAWTLVDYTGRDDTGAVHQPLGPGASGLLVYAEPDRMSAQLMAAGRPRWPKRSAPDHGEVLRAITDGYLAYAGTFTVDETAAVVTHVPDLSLIPNWVGRPQERRIAWAGDRLVLSTTEEPAAYVLTWQRLTAGRGTTP
jgi:hypothetical protein